MSLETLTRNVKSRTTLVPSVVTITDTWGQGFFYFMESLQTNETSGQSLGKMTT